MENHTKPLCGQTTTTYSQHLQPLWYTNGKQLSRPRVNKGFPYMEYHTKPLCGHTKPLRTLNTYNRCVTLMENDCEGPVLIRVSPYMEYYTKPLCEQTNPLRTPNTLNHCVTLMDNNSQGPVLIRVSPYMAYHTEPLCGQTEPLRKSYTHNQLCDKTWTQLSGPRVNKGFPPIWNITQNHFVGRQTHTQRPQPLCDTTGTQLPELREHTFQSPRFIRGSSS